MTEIAYGQRPRGPRSSMYYGSMGAGKTFICATYPRVAWFGSARENGQVTIQFMDPTDFYEPSRPPLLFIIRTIDEFWGHIKSKVLTLIKTGQVRTLVIELTCVAEDYIYVMDPKFKENKWGLYQGLANAIRTIDEFGREVGVQIAYNALAAHSEEVTKVPGGIAIPGRVLARTIPATTDLFGYMHAEENGDRILRFQQYGPYPARHRFGKLLPNYIRNPTYRSIELLLARKAVCNSNGIVVVDSAGKPTLQPLAKLGEESKPPQLPPLGGGSLPPLKK